MSQRVTELIVQDGTLATSGTQATLSTTNNVSTDVYNYDQNFILTAKSDTEIDIDCDILRVQGIVVTSVDLTIDISGTGANGLDTGGSGSRY